MEELLTAVMLPRNPDIVGNKYLIVGTMERKGWREARQEPHNLQKTFEHLHDFKDVVTFKAKHFGWGPADE